jgi:hypothetical protein
MSNQNYIERRVRDFVDLMEVWAQGAEQRATLETMLRRFAQQQLSAPAWKQLELDTIYNTDFAQRIYVVAKRLGVQLQDEDLHALSRDLFEEKSNG